MELWSLFSVHRLIILNICIKFHENISKGFELLRGHEIMPDGRTDGQIDGRTDGQGDYYRAPPTSSGGP